MTRAILLDSGPLGMIAHPRPNPNIAIWVMELLRCGADIVIPEIADYEVRRSLLLENLVHSVERLDELKETLTYLPLTTETILLAARFWAQTRRAHRPTTSPEALDGDVILAAQAALAGGIVATENVGHLASLVDARRWDEIGRE